jgi:hypothetical protein
VTLSQENEPEPQKKHKKMHFCNATVGKENPVAYFILVRLVYVLSGDFGQLSQW